MPVVFSDEIDSYIYAISIFVFFQLSRVVFRKITYRLVQKTTTTFDDEMLDAIKKTYRFPYL